MEPQAMLEDLLIVQCDLDDRIRRGEITEQQKQAVLASILNSLKTFQKEKK